MIISDMTAPLCGSLQTHLGTSDAVGSGHIIRAPKIGKLQCDDPVSGRRKAAPGFLCRTTLVRNGRDQKSLGTVSREAKNSETTHKSHSADKSFMSKLETKKKLSIWTACNGKTERRRRNSAALGGRSPAGDARLGIVRTHPKSGRSGPRENCYPLELCLQLLLRYPADT